MKKLIYNFRRINDTAVVSFPRKRESRGKLKGWIPCQARNDSNKATAKNVLILILSVIFITIAVNCTYASPANQLAVSIDPPSVQANMGDKITYTGTITNNSDKPVNNIIAYISLANVTQGKESPMDLEDWSANKPSTSSITAAPIIAFAAGVCSFFISCSTLAVIAILVAVKATPINIDSLKL